LLSVALTVTGKVPVCVGVPDSVPFAASVKPAGKALAVLKVVVPLPPLCVNVWLNGAPAVPVVVAGFVTVIVGQAMLSVSVAELFPGVGSVTPPGAVTVAVLESVPVAPAEIVQLAV